MALALTILSIVLCYFSPADLFPDLSAYHLQRFILIPAVVVSIETLNTRRVWHFPQYILMIGLWFAIVMSKLAQFKIGWAYDAFLAFATVVCVYFLVAVNSWTLRRLAILCRVIAICAVVMAIQAILAYYTGYRADDLLYTKVTEEGVELSKRVTGMGILHDPNDFSQFLLIGMAFLGLSWSKMNPLRNVITVFLPASILMFAIFLSDSRGAMFGIIAIAFVILSRRRSVAKTALLCGVLFGVMMAAHFGGGRDISLNEGSAAGRLYAWGSGIGQLKQNPLFGVGFGQFTQYNEFTAHNSFVLCFAELGFFGYFFWIALLVTTVMGLEALARAPTKNEEDVEFQRYVTVIRSALYAFLATSWFLSRTYHETLYIILAMGGALIFMRKKEIPMAVLPVMRWVPWTFCVQVASIVAIYVTIRLRAF